MLSGRELTSHEKKAWSQSPKHTGMHTNTLELYYQGGSI